MSEALTVLRSCDPIALSPCDPMATEYGEYHDDTCDCHHRPTGGEVVVIAEPCPTPLINIDAGFCDWDGCDALGIVWHWSPFHGWLPACEKHLGLGAPGVGGWLPMKPSGFVVAGFATIEALPIIGMTQAHSDQFTMPFAIDDPQDPHRVCLAGVPDETRETIVHVAEPAVRGGVVIIPTLMAGGLLRAQEVISGAVGSPIQVDWNEHDDRIGTVTS